MARTYLLVDSRCNNACVFCDQGQLDEIVSPTADLKDHLCSLAGDAVDEVIFCGGEVTLDLERLEELVAFAQEQGFETIAIQTNGRRLAYANVVQRLVEAGVNRFEVSLHGVNEVTHDWVTRDPGAFKQTIRGLKAIRRAGAEIALHMVLLRSNYRQIKDMVLLAAKLRVRALNLRFVVPEGRIAEEETLPSLVPKYSLVKPELMLAKSIAKRMGVSLYLHDFPDCVVGPLAPDLVRDAASWVGVDEEKWGRIEGVYAENCDSCAMKSQCMGVPQPYLSYYGSMELSPIVQQVPVESDREIAV